MKQNEKDVYLVVLEGGGDTQITLIKQESWDWIHQPYTSTSVYYLEKVPEPVQKELGVDEIRVSIGAYDNDRALAAKGVSFESLKDAFKYITKNDLNLVDEYHGCIY